MALILMAADNSELLIENEYYTDLIRNQMDSGKSFIQVSKNMYLSSSDIKRISFIEE